MRAIVYSLIVGLVPGLSLGETIEYTFTGSIEPDAPVSFPPNIWNGSGPEPSTFQMTFDVNTLSPLNSVSYTFSSSSHPVVDSITANLVTTNITFSVDGKTVPGSTSGTFGFSGTPLGGCCFYIGGFAAAGNDVGGFSFVPDFSLPVNTQAALMGSTDPLGLLLNGSFFATDDGCCGVFGFEDSQLAAVIRGSGTAVSAAEPSSLGLLALAGIGLGFVHRRRTLGVVARV